MWLAEKGLSNPDVVTAKFSEGERVGERLGARLSLLAVMGRQHLVTIDMKGEWRIVVDPCEINP